MCMLVHICLYIYGDVYVRLFMYFYIYTRVVVSWARSITIALTTEAVATTYLNPKP